MRLIQEIKLRITFILDEGRREDALLILETVGFVADDADPPPAADGKARVTGDLPEKSIADLSAIDGIVDWQILPLEEEKSGKDWPWDQKPETD